MSEFTPTLSHFRAVYGEMCADWCRDGSLAEFDRVIAKVKADALREAVEEFEGHVGAGEFDEQTRRNGTHWTHAVESWDHQGPFMYWLLNRADQIEREA